MTFDAVVMGAGVFGAWTALHLRRSGRTVALVDIYGAGNSRASSGGESRILRAGYGADEIYTRWAMRSRELWLELFEQIGRPELFQNTGVLFTPPPGDAYGASNQAAYEKYGVPFQRLGPDELARSFPQFRFREERVGLLETQAGVILARRAVQAVVAQAVREGVEYSEDAAVVRDRSSDYGLRLRALAAEDIPRNFGRPDSGDTPGDFFLWHAGRGSQLHSAADARLGGHHR